MFAEIKQAISSAFESYPTRKIGFIFGLIFGGAILTFGFFSTIFIFFCGIIGLYIGSRFEEGDDLVNQTLKSLEDAIPERFRYWKFFN